MIKWLQFHMSLESGQDSYQEEQITSTQSRSEVESQNERLSYEAMANAPYDIEMFEYGLDRVNFELQTISQRIHNSGFSNSDASQIWILEARKARLEYRLSQLQPYKDMITANVARYNAQIPAALAVEQITEAAVEVSTGTYNLNGIVENNGQDGITPGEANDIKTESVYAGDTNTTPATSTDPIPNPENTPTPPATPPFTPETGKTPRIRFDPEELSHAVHRYLKGKIDDTEYATYVDFLREPLGREVLPHDKALYMDKIEARVRELGREEGLELDRFDPNRSQRPLGIKTGLRYRRVDTASANLGNDLKAGKPNDVKPPEPAADDDEFINNPKYQLIESSYTFYRDVFAEVGCSVGDLGISTISVLLNQKGFQRITKQDLVRLGVGKEVSLNWTLTPQEFAVIYNMRKAGLDFDDGFHISYCKFLGIPVEINIADEPQSRNVHNEVRPRNNTNSPSMKGSNGDRPKVDSNRERAFQHNGRTSMHGQQESKKK